MNRGSVQDALYLGIFAFVTILFGYVIYSVFDTTQTDVGTALTTAGANTNSTSLLPRINDLTGGFINGLPLGLALAGILSVAFASLVPVSAIFLPIGIIMLVFSVVLFAYINNFSVQLMGTSFFSSFSSSYPLTTSIFTHLDLFVLLFGALILIVIYGRVRQPAAGAGGPEG